MEQNDDIFMSEALRYAQMALECGEVPVGAVIIKDGELLCGAHNLRETDNVATAHAELLAIEEACRILGSWRLTGCSLYVTLEPCPMCSGAIVNSRIERVIYGAKDPLAGCCGSLLNLNAYPFNHSFSLKQGVMEKECGELLQKFFEEKRKQRKFKK